MSAVWGVLFGIAVFAAALCAVMAVVPRHGEGVRQIVAIPWALYASCQGRSAR
jgi:hypothetical protein